MRQVDRHVLPLRVALEHAFEGELAADTAFFVTAVGMTWALTEALVHLNPTSLDRVCRAQSPADVMAWSGRALGCKGTGGDRFAYARGERRS